MCEKGATWRQRRAATGISLYGIYMRICGYHPYCRTPTQAAAKRPLLGWRGPRSPEPADSETRAASRKAHIPGIPASTAFESLAFRLLRPGRRGEAALGKAAAHRSGWIAPLAGRLSPSPAGRRAADRAKRQDRSTPRGDAVVNGASQLLQGGVRICPIGPPFAVRRGRKR